MQRRFADRFFICTILSIAICFISNGQSAKDTSAAFRLIKNNEVFLSLNGGPNFTFVKPQLVNDGGFFPGNGAISAGTQGGYNFNLDAKLKFSEGIILGTGISCSMQSYFLSQVGGSDSLQPANYNSFTPNYNDDRYTCTFENYYVSVPLTIGYRISHRSWSYYTSLGVEFYYNYMDKQSMVDNTKDVLLEQSTFYHGTPNWHTLYAPFGLVNFSWATTGVFGLLNAGLSYNINPRLSAAFESAIEFTNPFAPNPAIESISPIRGLANVSLNFGLYYSFEIQDIGSFKPVEKDDKSYKYSVGFNLIPNYYRYPISQLGYNAGMSFSYEIAGQLKLSEFLALKSGLILDNFTPDNYLNYVFAGLPVLIKYFIPGKKGPSSYYLGAGCHVDYHISYGTQVYDPYKYILPIALIEMGYEMPVADKYCFDFALGYGHELKYIELSDRVTSPSFSQLPHLFYSSIGFSYKFK